MHVSSQVACLAGSWGAAVPAGDRGQEGDFIAKTREDERVHKSSEGEERKGTAASGFWQARTTF